MSIFSAIAGKIREVFTKLVGSKTIEKELKIAPVISTDMNEAISLWYEMYKNNAPWLHSPTVADPTNVVSLGLPAFIASEFARPVLNEFECLITAETANEDNKIINENKGATTGIIYTDVTRAEFLSDQFETLQAQLRTQVEYAIAVGGSVIKPYIVLDDYTDGDGKKRETAKIEFDFIQANNFYPLAFDASGKITEAAFIQTKQDKNVTYRRLEHHKFDKNKLVVTNRAYRQYNTSINNANGELGEEINLSTVPEWADIKSKQEISNVTMPLFSYFKMPDANTIDTYSPLGVSKFSRAVGLIEEADKQYSRLLWEYEGGELAVDVDRDVLLKDENGSQMGHLQRRLYRITGDLDGAAPYNPYNPSLRDTNYLQGLNEIKREIEDLTGLSRGTISDPTNEAMTATQLMIQKERTQNSINGIRDALKTSLKEVIYIMDAYCTLYNVTEESGYTVSFSANDSVLTDDDTENAKWLMLMQNQLAGRVETRMKITGETEEQATEAIKKLDAENLRMAEERLNGVTLPM